MFHSKTLPRQSIRFLSVCHETIKDYQFTLPKDASYCNRISAASATGKFQILVARALFAGGIIPWYNVNLENNVWSSNYANRRIQ